MGRYEQGNEATVIEIPGQRVRTCDWTTRREWLRVGGLSALGLSLPQLLARPSLGGESPRPVGGIPEKAHSVPPRIGSGSFGRAKSCILLFLFGAPAHQDTWDLKPDAPSEVRGEFQPIATKTPGLFIGEHLPMLAARSDRYSLIRSVTHEDNTHTVAMHYMLAGIRHKRPNTNPQNAADDFPCFGAVMNYAQQHGFRSGRPQTTATNALQTGLPTAVSLNAPANQVSANNHIFPGFFAGMIGGSYDPLFISQHPNQPDFRPVVAQESPERLQSRQELTRAYQQQVRRLEEIASVRRLNEQQSQAVRLLASPEARVAFELEKEDAATRARFGATPFGQGCLLARRLVEAGVSLVTVNWERDDAYWDTHKNNFIDLKTKLLPNFDQGCSALLDDLQSRGLLDETLVVCLGEFGRTPKINNAAGRDHWAACNSVMLFGAGLPGGFVYGASDRTAAFPARDAVSPEALAATIYHLLGVDPRLVLYDAQRRPVSLLHADPIDALL